MVPRVERFAENPLIAPEQVRPSLEGWEVVCAFNPGAIRFRDEVVLLVRVAERPRSEDPGELTAPVLDLSSGAPYLRPVRFPRGDPDLVEMDPRWFIYRGQTYLSTISHLRVARSRDQRRFVVEDHPALAPEMWYESFGIEDPRITELEGRYLITYTAVSAHGIATALAETADFVTYARRGVIFPPENRDVAIFPEQVGGRYVCHHRPFPRHIGAPSLWAASSPDLQHWGRHELVMTPRRGLWDGGRIGGGAVPIKTDRGWLAIYHGADEQNRYALGAVLCDLAQPARVLARSAQPLLVPEAPYEVAGFFGNVVFTCGTIVEDDTLAIFYGAADRCVCAASVSLSEVLDSLTPITS